MTTRTLFIGEGYDPLPFNSTPVYAAVMVDENDVPMGPGAFTTLTLSIVDTLSGAIINGVDNVNILNTGRGTLDANGNLTVAFLAADMAPYNAEDDQEQRSLVFGWTYNGGAKVGAHQVDFQLQALSA